MGNKAEIYLSIEDLRKLMFCSKHSAQRRHLAIRDTISNGTGKKENLTIYEYCEQTKDPYRIIYQFLRGTPPPFDPDDTTLKEPE